MAGELELYVRIPSLSSLADTEVYLYYGNAGAAETNDADTWNADYGVVYHLKEDPTGTAPQARDSTANAVHGTYDVAGATVEANTFWGGSCILFDNGPRLRVDDNPAIENADRITIEAWVNTLSWPARAVVCRKEAPIPLQLQRRLLLVPLRARQPAAARHRRHARERGLGLHSRHL
jgi:hypothetical protein